jgi:hypothetical protein
VPSAFPCGRQLRDTNQSVLDIALSTVSDRTKVLQKLLRAIFPFLLGTIDKQRSHSTSLLLSRPKTTGKKGGK